MNRRVAFTDVARSALPDMPTLPVLRDLGLIRVSRQAMATTFEIALPADTPDAVAAASSALDLIEDAEDALTVYREHSETVRLHATAFEHPVEVSEMLFDLLSRCASLVQLSDGAFDPAGGALVKAWGFYKRAGRVPSAEELSIARAASGFRHVLLDSQRRTVKFLRRGLELNFGSIGKGFAIDLAAKHLREVWGISAALLHGGVSSAYAIGVPPGHPQGWPIRLKHPHHPRRALGTIALADSGLGVSAATYQSFVHAGKSYGHVIDPRTGLPSAGMACAAVVARTAATADALSTAAFVLGAAKAEAVLESVPSSWILLSEGKDARPIYGGDAVRPVRG